MDSRQRTQKLQEHVDDFRAANPDMVRVLDALGIRVDHYEQGLADATTVTASRTTAGSETPVRGSVSTS